MADNSTEPFFLKEAGPANSPNPVEGMTKPPPKRVKRSWIYWLPRLVVLAVILVVVGIEVWGRAGVSLTRRRLEALVSARLKILPAVGQVPPEKIMEQELTIDEVRSHLILAPREWTEPRGKGKVIGFTWPSLFAGCHLRVIMTAEGQIQAIDTVSIKDDDITSPFVSRGRAGLGPGLKPGEHYVPPNLAAPTVPLPKDFSVAVREAFAKPEAPLPPGVLIVPFVDASENTQRIGPALAIITSYMLAHTGRPLLGHDPRFHASNISKLYLDMPGWKIDDKRFSLLKSMTGARQWVRSSLVEEGTDLVLTAQFESDLPGVKPAKFVHRVPLTSARQFPILLARDLFTHLGVTLDQEDESRLASSSMSSEEVLQKFQSLLETHATKADILLLDELNCLAASDIFESRGNFGRSAKEPWLFSLHHCELEADFGAVNYKLAELLELAPMARQHPRYNLALCNLAARMDDVPLVEQLLIQWGKDDPTAVGLTLRGQFLIRWAWKARGNGWASQVTPEGAKLFAERIDRAGRILQLAARDPLAWEAHSEIIQVHMVSSVSYGVLLHHMHAAANIDPSNSIPYRKVLHAIKKRWGGDRVTRLAFARECLATGQWQAGIPHVGMEALFEEASDGTGAGTSWSAWRSTELWLLMQEFAAAAERQPHAVQRDSARLSLLSAGIRGGHFDELVPVLDWLESMPQTKRSKLLNERGLPGESRYVYYRDLINAHRTDGESSPLAQARVALVEARPSAAELALAAFENNAMSSSEEEKAESLRLRHALELAKTFKSMGQIEISPQQLLETCVEFGPNGRRPIKVSPHWSVQGDLLVWELPAPKKDEDPFVNVETMLLLPMGSLEADIEGRLELYDCTNCRLELNLHAQGARDQVRFVNENNQIWGERLGYTIRRDPVSATISTRSPRFRIRSRRMAEQVEPSVGEFWELEVFDDAPSSHGITLQARPGSKFGISAIRFKDAM